MDEEEDRRYGRDKRGDELPEELAFRESRLRRIREAMAALESEAREAAEAAEFHTSGCARRQGAAELHRPRIPHHARPGGEGFPAGLQLPGGGGRCPSGDSGGRGDQPGVGQAAGSEHDRAGHRQHWRSAEGGVRDAGYYSARAVEGLIALGVDPFIAPDKTRHGQAIPPASRGRIPANLSARDRMRRKLRTKRGRRRYAIRKETVEPVFQIKQGRGLPAIPAAGSGEGEPGVVPDLHGAQPAEAVPVWVRVGRSGETPVLGPEPATLWPMLRQWGCYRPKRTKPLIAIWFRLHMNQSAIPRTGC